MPSTTRAPADALGRRDFVRTLGLGLAGALAVPLAAAPAPPVLRLAVLAAGSGARGVTLGVEEAARTGALLGRGVEAVPVDDPAEAERLMRAGVVAAVVGGREPAECLALGRLAAATGAVHVNVACREDDLRACGGRTLHVEAADAMYRDAMRGAAAEARAVLWAATLDRFGAAQLNDRFRARFAAPMDGAAWAGWMAVKVTWEASLRAASPGALLAALDRPGLRFDGHKGRPLAFQPGTRQLRQPLYLVAGPADAPRLLGEASSDAALDRAGAPHLLCPDTP